MKSRDCVADSPALAAFPHAVQRVAGSNRGSRFCGASLCAAPRPGQAGCYSAASVGFFDLRGALATLAAPRFFAFAAAFGGAALAAGADRAGRLRREVDPPPRSARASTSPAASSRVMVSGVLSFGRFALTPLWLT